MQIGQEISQGGFLTTFPMARGGDVTCLTCIVLSPGGSASSRSIGTAAGDSLVTVFDLAIGGSSQVAPFAVPYGGPGGAASSAATATGGGVSTVRASSEARGGLGGLLASGGDADSAARASGAGRVEATARAVGGSIAFGQIIPTPFSSGGSAIAHASADGASGFARAEAVSGFGTQPRVRAQSEAQVGSRRDVAAAATDGAALASAPSEPGLEGSAFITTAPLASDVDAARAGNAALSQVFADGSANMLALAHWQADASGDPLALSTDLELVMGGNTDASRYLELGAFGVTVLGDHFESLSFSLEKNGAVVTSQDFATAQEVAAFFTDVIFDLGAGWARGDTLLAHFDLALGPDTRFAMGLAYATAAVPEPGTGLLLVFGLVQFALVRRFG